MSTRAHAIAAATAHFDNGHYFHELQRRIARRTESDTGQAPAALTALRATLADLLPGHLEVISYAMPGFRQPGPKGKMVAGYAAFARHLGLYPHSGRIIPQLAADCTLAVWLDCRTAGLPLLS